MLPNSKSVAVQPLFGPRFKDVRLIDHELNNAVFYLVSGHGGPDTGAIGKEGDHLLYEDEYAYDVTLRLGRRLMEHGARVYFIIRDPQSEISDERYLPGNKDERCYPNDPIPLNQRKRLQQRASAVNTLYRQDPDTRYKRCIVVHVDSRSRNQKIDIFFYHHSKSRAGKQLADQMRDTIQEMYRNG